ncbi:MAG: hypothetical protein ACOY4I_13705 [Bacillota bacterium]
MQLSPGERSILAYFPSGDAAREAAGALESSGYDRPQVDRVSRYGTTADSHVNNPINRAVTGIGPTLYSDGTGGELSDSERVLLAADPSASGIGNYNYGVAGGKAFLLTLVTTEENIGPAEKIISRYGGMV